MKLALTLAAMLLATTAHAQVTGTTTSGANADVVSSAQNAGNAQSIGFNSNSPSWIKTTPGLGSAVFPVSNSPKSCNSATGGSAVGPAVGGQISMISHGHSCEMLLIYDAMQMTATTLHNMGVNSKDPAAGLALQADAAVIRQVAFDHACMVSIVTFKIMSSQGLCSPVTHLMAATGVLAADPNSYQATTKSPTGEY